MRVWSGGFTTAFFVNFIVTILFLTVPLQPNSALSKWLQA